MDTLLRGLDFAVADYVRIAERRAHDVKPKEDQIKCGLYRAFSESGHLVHVEAAYERHGNECDLVVIDGDVETAIEIKTAWAGQYWNNKPPEQAGTWAKDIEKLMGLADRPHVNAGIFILMLAFQEGSSAERALRCEIERIGCEPAFQSDRIPIAEWNGLDRLQYFVFRVFG